jgi:hypothetical protein
MPWGFLWAVSTPSVRPVVARPQQAALAEIRQAF